MSDSSYWFGFVDNQILFNEGNASLCVPLCVNNPYKTSDDVLYVGSLHGHA